MNSQTKIIEKILKSYETILENKKFILESPTLVKLLDTNYSNVKFDTDGTQNDSVNKVLLDDLNAAAESAGVVVTITTAVSGHPSTVQGSNAPSRHPQGTAVDISKLNGIGSDGATNATNGSSNFRTLGNKMKDALVSMGYKLNQESGNEKAVLWQTNLGGNHYNHLHVSNNSEQASSNSNSSTATTSTNLGDLSVSDSSSRNRKFIERIAPAIISTTVGLTEDFSFFGEKVTNNQGVLKIGSKNNQKILSGESGKVVNYSPVESCTNQVVIEFKNGDSKSFLVYCGISSPSVYVGDKVGKGEKLGSSDTDVTVTLYNQRGKKTKINKTPQIKTPKEKENFSKPYKSSDPPIGKLLHTVRHNLGKNIKFKMFEQEVERIKGLLK